MSSIHPDLARRSRLPAYLILGLVTILPLFDVVALAWPFHPHTINWRFGAVGTIAGSAVAPLLGLVLILELATRIGDRVPIWVVAVLAALWSLLCLTGSGVFILDVLEIRGRVRSQMVERFSVASVWALVKLLLAAIVGAVLAVSAYRTARSSRIEAKRVSRAIPSLVVGHSAKTSADQAPVGEPRMEASPNS